MAVVLDAWERNEDPRTIGFHEPHSKAAGQQRASKHYLLNAGLFIQATNIAVTSDHKRGPREKPIIELLRRQYGDKETLNIKGTEGWVIEGV